MYEFNKYETKSRSKYVLIVVIIVAFEGGLQFDRLIRAVTVVSVLIGFQFQVPLAFVEWVELVF